MKIWIRRVSALGLLSLGTALIFLPYNETRSGKIEQKVVLLQTEELLDPGEIQTRYPGQEITAITGHDVNPKDYPDLWRAFMNLGQDWTRDTVDPDEWNRFQTAVLNGPSPLRLVAFRDKLIDCSVKQQQPGEAQNGSPVAMFNYLGRYNSRIRKLSEADLSDFPAIIKAIDALRERGSTTGSPPPIPQREWDRMKKRFLTPLVDAQTFHFNGVFYGPEFCLDVVRMEGRVRGLRTALAIIGVLCLVVGSLVLKRLYIKKKGIMINPRKIAILFDAVVLVFAIPSAYMVVNTLLEKLLFIPRFIDDNFIVLMGNYFFVAGIPVVTLYSSRFTSQSIEITTDGILVDSMAGKEFMPWESLTSMELSDEYVPVGRMGTMVPKQLQKRLKLVDTSARCLMVNEPHLSSVKRRIIKKFQEYAPDSVRGEILDRLKGW